MYHVITKQVVSGHYILKYMQCMRYRVPLDQPVSAVLLQVTFEKKARVEESQVDGGNKEVAHPEEESQVGRTDKEVGHPGDEQLLAAPIHHHPVPPLEQPHPFVETVSMSTAPAMTAKQELLFPLDSSPASKVRNTYVHVNALFLHKKIRQSLKQELNTL